MHERCTGHKRNGDPCGQHPLRGGTGVCARVHGSAPQVRRKAAQRVALAEAQAATAEHLRLGGGAVIGPTADVMLDVFRSKAWDELVLRHLVASLDAETEQAPLTAAGESVLWMARSIAGPTGSTSKTHDAAPHVWVTMHAQAQRDLMAFGKAIREAGVEEARLELDRADTQRMIAVVRGITEAALAVVLDVLGEVAPDAAGVVRERWVAELPGVIRAQVASVTGELEAAA